MSVELWEHQKKWGDKLLAGEVSALLWAMRSGKTLTAIHGSRDGDRLIVCPNGVKPVWERDLRLYGETDIMIWDSKSRTKARPKNLIINYESVWRSPIILKSGWDTIIFDESHRLANLRTKLWKGVQDALNVIHHNRIILLSGTPCPEGVHQLITQSILATGDFLGFASAWEALEWGWEYNQYNYKWEPRYGITEKAKEKLHSFSSTMTQAEAGITTRKLHRVVEVAAGPYELKIHKALFKEDMEPMQMAQLAQSCSSGRDPEDAVVEKSAKLDAVATYAVDIDMPCVILTHFTASLTYLVDKFKELGIAVEAIHGDDGMNAAQRFKVIERFDKDVTKIIVASIPTIKVGLNLSKSNTLIFAENDWSGEARIQAEERATVRGKDAVEIIDFVTVSEDFGNIDTRIMDTVRGKKDFQASIMRRK